MPNGADHEEIIRMRERIHQMASDTTAEFGRLTVSLHELAVEVERLKTEIPHLISALGDLREDGKANRRALYLLAIAAIGSSLTFAFGVTQLLGH